MHDNKVVEWIKSFENTSNDLDTFKLNEVYEIQPIEQYCQSNIKYIQICEACEKLQKGDYKVVIEDTEQFLLQQKRHNLYSKKLLKNQKKRQEYIKEKKHLDQINEQQMQNHILDNNNDLKQQTILDQSKQILQKIDEQQEKNQSLQNQQQQINNNEIEILNSNKNKITDENSQNIVSEQIQVSEAKEQQPQQQEQQQQQQQQTKKKRKSKKKNRNKNNNNNQNNIEEEFSNQNCIINNLSQMAHILQSHQGNQACSKHKNKNCRQGPNNECFLSTMEKDLEKLIYNSDFEKLSDSQESLKMFGEKLKFVSDVIEEKVQQAKDNYYRSCQLQGQKPKAFQINKENIIKDLIKNMTIETEIDSDNEEETNFIINSNNMPQDSKGLLVFQDGEDDQVDHNMLNNQFLKNIHQHQFNNPFEDTQVIYTKTSISKIISKADINNKNIKIYKINH